MPATRHRVALVLLALAGCAEAEGTLRRPPGPAASDTDAVNIDPDPDSTDNDADTDTDTDTDVDTDTADSSCPLHMVLVDERFCIDRFEASLALPDGTPRSPFLTLAPGERVRAVVRPGEPPAAYLSGDEAAAACAASSKRLCTSDEWLQACTGPAGTPFPYGERYNPDACNDTYAGSHPVIDYFGHADVWDPASMNDPGINQQPGTVAPAGGFADCVSAWGVHDMHGNLHEWVVDPSGTFRGGFYGDARINGLGCSYRTTAHGRTYHDYSTGFRCCADPG